MEQHKKESLSRFEKYMFGGIISAAIVVLFFVLFQTTASAATHTWPNGTQTLQALINSATVANGDTVAVASGTYGYGTGVSNLGNGTPMLSVSKGITLTSASGNPVDVIFDGGSSHQIISLNHTSALLNSMTLQNGKASGSNSAAAVLLTGGTVDNCIIKDNQFSGVSGTTAVTTGVLRIHNTGGGNAVVKNSIFKDNKGQDASPHGYSTLTISRGIASSNIKIDNCVFDRNSMINTTVSNGWNTSSGISVVGNVASVISISNCEFKNNYTRANGGLITAGSANATVNVDKVYMHDNIFEDDPALRASDYSGYCILAMAGPMNVTNSVFVNNTGGCTVYFWVNGYIENCAIRGNTSRFRTAVDVSQHNTISGANPKLVNLTIEDNKSGANGGGLTIGSGVITNCIIRNNVAAGNGGGVYMHVLKEHTGIGDAGPAKPIQISNTQIYSNTAENHGGGIYLFHATDLNNITITMTNCSIFDNEAKAESAAVTASGGGVYLEYSPSYNPTGSNMILNNTTVVNNRAVATGNGSALGGGTYMPKPTTRTNYGLTLNQTTIAGNTAIVGGGIWTDWDAGKASSINSIIVGNKANLGGDDIYDKSTAFSNIATSTLVGNGSSVSPQTVFGTTSIAPTTNGGPQVGAGTTAFTAGVSGMVGGQTASSSQSITPTLSTEQLQAVKLHKSGVAVDKLASTALGTDYRGSGFPRPNAGGQVDYGAMEMQSADTVPGVLPTAPSAPTPMPTGSTPGPMPNTGIKNPTSTQAGFLSLHQYVSPTNMEGVYRVTYTLDTDVFPYVGSSVDVVLVMDVTGSMELNLGSGETRMTAAKAALKTMTDAFYGKDSAGQYKSNSAEFVNIALVTYGAGGEVATGNPYDTNGTPLLTTFYGSTTPDLARAGLVEIAGQQSGLNTTNGAEVPGYFVNFNAYQTGGSSSISGGALNYAIEKLKSGWAYDQQYVSSTSDVGLIDTTHAGVYYGRKLLEQAASEASSASLNAHDQVMILLNDGGAQMMFDLDTSNTQIVHKDGTAGLPFNSVTSVDDYTAIEPLTAGTTPFTYTSITGISSPTGYPPTTITTAMMKNLAWKYQTGTLQAVAGHAWANTAGNVNDADRYNMLAVIAEAQLVKDKNTKVYSIGLGDNFTDPSKPYKWLAESCASNGISTDGDPDQDVFLLDDASTVGGLTTAFEKIADAIKSIPKITSPSIGIDIKMVEYFDLYKFPGQPLLEASGSSYLTHTATQTTSGIDWKITGTFQGKDHGQLVYYVKIDEDAPKDVYLPPTESATVRYADEDGKWQTAKFPLPYILSGGTEIDPDFDPDNNIAPDGGNTNGGTGNGFLPLSGNGINYTPSVTPSKNQIENETLQEGNEAVPITTTQGLVTILSIIAVAGGAAVLAILLKRRRR